MNKIIEQSVRLREVVHTERESKQHTQTRVTLLRVRLL
jgi:hypothetical protein